MRILIASLCLILSSCAGIDKKFNTVEDRPDELSVTPPNCPNWEEGVEGGVTNNPHSNFSCATVTNYGVMLTNPRDMIKGRGSDQSDAERSALAVKGYNSGVLSGGQSGADAAASSTAAEEGAAQ